MGIIQIYITHESIEEAQKMADHLLEKRLIACSNIFPIQSAYWWEGKVEKTGEWVSLVKTREENWDKVKDEVKKMHKYTVPCIMKIPIEANKEYEDWIKKETET